MTASRFIPLIDTVFVGRALSLAALPALTLRLHSVEPLVPATMSAVEVRTAEHSFALYFTVVETTAKQDTYALTHARMGAFAALLVPSRNARTLVAIFNRVV